MPLIDHAGILAGGAPGVGTRWNPPRWGKFECFNGKVCNCGNNCGGYCERAKKIARKKAEKEFPGSDVDMPIGRHSDTPVLTVPVYTYEEELGCTVRKELGQIEIKYPQGVKVERY